MKAPSSPRPTRKVKPRKRAKTTAAGKGRPLLRRRRYLVNRLAQIRFSFKLLVHVGAFYLVAGVLVWYQTLRFLSILKDIPASTDTEVARITDQVLAAKSHFFLVGVGMSVLATLYISAVGTYASHRLTGPSHRLRRHLAETLFSETAVPIRFRRTDHLDELAEQLNVTAQALAQRRQEIAHTLESLAGQVRLLQRAEAPDEAETLLGEMEDQLRQLTATMETGAEPMDAG